MSRLLSLLLVAAAAAPVVAAPQRSDAEALYAGGTTFAEFLQAANRRRAQWHRNYEVGAPEPEQVARASALPPGLRLLVVATAACGDSVNTIPYLARLVEQVPGLDLRMVEPDAGASVLERYRTPDDRGATPTVVVLDGEGREAGAWVERPSELQQWFLASEATLGRTELYDRKYGWYDEDLGRSTVREIVDLLEAAGRPGVASPSAAMTLTSQRSPTGSLLQAIHPVDESVVWASGHDGTWVRTLDGGATWTAGTVPGGETLQFRDVHATGPDSAWLLSAGNGADSRIYRTSDGGATWTLQFLNDDERAFFDCFAFWDERRGVAFSDSVDGRFVILRTDDGGATWRRVPPEAMPDAQIGEGSFAASGTCVMVGAGGRAWIGTGAAAVARVLHSEDWGQRWRAVDTPVVAGPAAGIASIVLAGPETLLALGGDVSAPETPVAGIARSTDGGRSWTSAGRASGAVYGAAQVPGRGTIVAVGPAGMDLSDDLGDAWRRIDSRPHWAVAFASARRGWAVGPGGTITRLEPTGETSGADR